MSNNQLPEDKYLKGFMLMIPSGPFRRNQMVEDPKGAPIYAGCPGKGPCACTGTCRKIVGYSQDPEDLQKYRDYIKWYNDPIVIDYSGKVSDETDQNGTKIRVWEFDQPKQLNK